MLYLSENNENTVRRVIKENYDIYLYETDIT